jgi:ATP-dependent Clp protease ATP-binding subunit ClpC
LIAMWQRFTENARKVVFYAQEEAGNLGDGYISTEHLLLGLIREVGGDAVQILNRLNVSLDALRAGIERHMIGGHGRSALEIQLTSRARHIIDLAYDEARLLGNNSIGAEHLLLGLIREGDGLAGQALAKLGVGLEQARQAVLEFQKEKSGHQP